MIRVPKSEMDVINEMIKTKDENEKVSLEVRVLKFQVNQMKETRTRV